MTDLATAANLIKSLPKLPPTVHGTLLIASGVLTFASAGWLNIPEEHALRVAAPVTFVVLASWLIMLGLARLWTPFTAVIEKRAAAQQTVEHKNAIFDAVQTIEPALEAALIGALIDGKACVELPYNSIDVQMFHAVGGIDRLEALILKQVGPYFIDPFTREALEQKHAESDLELHEIRRNLIIEAHKLRRERRGPEGLELLSSSDRGPAS